MIYLGLVEKIFPQLEVSVEQQRDAVGEFHYHLRIISRDDDNLRLFAKHHVFPAYRLEYLPPDYVEEEILQDCLEVLKHRYKKTNPRRIR